MRFLFKARWRCYSLYDLVVIPGVLLGALAAGAGPFTIIGLGVVLGITSAAIGMQFEEPTDMWRGR